MDHNFATALREYEKDKNLKKSDVKNVIEWIKKQPHLPCLTEFQVIIFLQSCYLNIESTKAAIENYYTIKSHCPEIFSLMSQDEIKNSLKVQMNTVLPKKTQEGYDIFYSRLLDKDTSNFNYPHMLALMGMVISLETAQRGSSLGHILVIDIDGYQMGHMLKFNPMLTKKYICFLQEGLPVRLKAVHLINSFSIVDTALNMIRPFMNSSLINLIHIHTKMETFFQHVSQDLMPNEYGGEAGSFLELKDDIQLKLLANYDYFVDDNHLVVDESKRIGKSKILEQLFDVGVEGTFKKLDID